MDPLSLREKEIFETLKKIQRHKFVVIGGYAVNAYTLPRFSVDCDIVVKNDEELEDIQMILVDFGYVKVQADSEIPYHGRFERYEKTLPNKFKVSMDILIEEILDRQTNATFSADWVFENSSIRRLRGKTISEELKLRIINADALFAMKMISCRSTDIRDIFLLITSVDKNTVKKKVEQRYDFHDRWNKLNKEITSKKFKNGLQGVFGIIDETTFEKHKKLILELGK